jgi:hypothetical protein
MPTLTTMPFPAAAALTENGAFGLVRVPGSGCGGSHDDPARGGRPAVPGGRAPDGGLAGCQASHGYPLGINGHLVPAAARVAGLELIWGGWVAAYRRSMIPRMKAAWPACWRPSAMMLTSRTLSVTGGSQLSSTMRGRSASVRPFTKRIVRSWTAS